MKYINQLTDYLLLRAGMPLTVGILALLLGTPIFGVMFGLAELAGTGYGLRTLMLQILGTAVGGAIGGWLAAKFFD